MRPLLKRLVRRCSAAYSLSLLAALLVPALMAEPHWEYLGPDNCAPPFQWGYGPEAVAGRCASAAFDPTDSQKMYVASANGGVWKTADAGSTWNPLGDSWPGMTASCVAVDPQNPNTIYVGTGDWDGAGGLGHGIEKTTNGGVTWANLGNGQFGNYAVRRILVDPDLPQIVTVVASRGVSGNGRVWRSFDGGNTWSAAIDVPARWSDIVCSAKDGSGNRTYYACAGGGAAQVWSSGNRGATWTRLTVPLRTGVSDDDVADLATSPLSISTVYLLGTGDRKVWKSVNSGATWSDVTNSALLTTDWTQAASGASLSCSTRGPSDVLYVGLADILQSWDGGASWCSAMKAFTSQDQAHAGQHDIVIDPRNPFRFMACNDGGVYIASVNATSGVAAFSGLNAHLGVMDFTYGDFHPYDPTRLIGGALGNGTPAAFGDGFWNIVTSGSGGAALIDQLQPDTQYSTYQYYGAGAGGHMVGFYRTTNNWTNSNWIQTNVGADRVPFLGPIVMAATDPNTLYLGTDYLWKFTSSKTLWTPRLGGQQLSTAGTISAIAVTAADPDVICTGSTDGELWCSRDSGETWSRIDAGSASLPSGPISAIRVQDTNAEDVLVAVSGSGSRLWRCQNTSAATRVWANVSGLGTTALPDVPIRAIERDPSSPSSIWYAGTDVGVYRTSNAGATWESISQPLGLPNVRIVALKIRAGYLCAATMGRGMWRLQLPDPGDGSNLVLTGFTIAPESVVGPGIANARVTLSGPAPLDGLSIGIKADSPLSGFIGRVVVEEGQTSATFPIKVSAVSTQTAITFQAQVNSTRARATLTVNPDGLTGISVQPSNVLGGTICQGSVTIANPAPPGGSSVSLNSSDPVAAVPETVQVPEGQTSATFAVATAATSSDVQATITATQGVSSVSTTVTVRAPSPVSLNIDPPTVVGGNTATATYTLDGPAPSGGAVVTLSNSDIQAVTVPATVTVPAGSATAVFQVQTHSVIGNRSVTIGGEYRGITQTAALSVLSQQIQSLSLSPNPVLGGAAVQGTVTLVGPSVGDLVVSLSSTSTRAVVPASITIPNGASSGTFTVTTSAVQNNTTATIFAIAGSSAVSANLVIQPLHLSGFTLSSNSVFEGTSVVGTVSLNGPAPAGGVVVQISQSNGAAATIPSSVTVPAGQVSKTFTVTAKTVSSQQTTTITAKRGTDVLTQVLTVKPITIDSFVVTNSTVRGGTTVQGVVHIIAPAPSGGYVVTLTSSNTRVAVVPGSVTIPAGSTSVVFNVVTRSVRQITFVTLTAKHGASSKSLQLQVTP